MDFFYYKSELSNFGDDLNTWIWDDLLPGWREAAPDVTLFGVGTILNTQNLAPYRNQKLLVAGSGLGYGDTPQPLGPLWDMRSVRGPKSAAALGLGAEKGIIDPAIMLPRLPEFQNIPKTDTPLFVPHFVSAPRHDWEAIAASLDMDYITPEEDAKKVIRTIAAAPLVIAESMHAAIIADAFRVPWIPVAISERFLDSKWHDWAASLDMEFSRTKRLFSDTDFLFNNMRKVKEWIKPKKKTTPPPRKNADTGAAPARFVIQDNKYRLKLERRVAAKRLQAVAQEPPRLSDPAILNAAQDRYQAVLDGIKHDYGLKAK